MGREPQSYQEEKDEGNRKHLECIKLQNKAFDWHSNHLQCTGIHITLSTEKTTRNNGILSS